MATYYSLFSFFLLYYIIIKATLSISTPCGEVTILCQDTNNPACCEGDCCPYLNVYREPQLGAIAIPSANTYTQPIILPQAAPSVTCEQGLSYVNCLVAPCSRSSCAAYPTATCTNDQCGGCNAIWALPSGIQLTHEECAQNVAPSTSKPTTIILPAQTVNNPSNTAMNSIPTMPPCNIGYFACDPSPCDTTTCAAYPTAICTNDHCGGCNAIWMKQNGDILTEAQCNYKPPVLVQPVIINTPPPKFGQDHILPSGACALYGLNVVNCLVSPCSVQKCPRWPQATCTDDFCGGCRAIFALYGVPLTAEQCALPATTTTTSTTSKPVTTTTTTTTSKPVTTTQLHQVPPCIIGFVACNPIPCSVSECPAHPNAICTNNFCGGCSATWTDNINGNILSAEECAPVPETSTTTTSTLPATTTTTSSTLPSTTSSTLPTTTAATLPATTTTTTSTTAILQPAIGICTLGLFDCNPTPCELEHCAYPNAVCINNNCGGCYAIFKDQNGVELTSAQCTTTTTSPTLPATTTTTTSAAPVTTTTSTSTVPVTTTTSTSTLPATTQAPQVETLPSAVSNVDTTSSTSLPAPATSTRPPLVQPVVVTEPEVNPPVTEKPATTTVTVEIPPKVEPVTEKPATTKVTVEIPPKVEPVTERPATTKVTVEIPPPIEPVTEKPVSTLSTAAIEPQTCAAIGEMCNRDLPVGERCCLSDGIAECTFEPDLTKADIQIGRCCVKHRKKGCTKDEDCCRFGVDGYCNANGKCKRDKTIIIAAAARDVENRFDNFEMVNDEKGTNYMTISLSTVTLIFVVVLIVIPMSYYWYYKKCILKKLKKEVRREVFHGLEINAHSDNEFEDSTEDNFID